MIEIAEGIAVDESEAEITAIRAQGSGGQKVNKTSAAVHLRFDIAASSLPEFCKARLLALTDSRITKEGVVVIKSQQHRSREQNVEEAFERLAELIAGVLKKKKHRVATKPTRSSVKKRLASKKQHGTKKELRKKIDSD